MIWCTSSCSEPSEGPSPFKMWIIAQNSSYPSRSEKKRKIYSNISKYLPYFEAYIAKSIILLLSWPQNFSFVMPTLNSSSFATEPSKMPRINLRRTRAISGKLSKDHLKSEESKWLEYRVNGFYRQDANEVKARDGSLAQKIDYLVLVSHTIICESSAPDTRSHGISLFHAKLRTLSLWPSKIFCWSI